MKKKTLIIIGVILAFLVLTAFAAFDMRLEVTEYIIDSEKIESDVRIALVTDLHSCDYGENAQEIFEHIDAYVPDVILLGGDIFDDVLPQEKARIFVSEAAKKYPTYYVSGNHEWWSGRMYEMFEYLDDCGVNILRGDCDTVSLNGQTVNICGIDDADVNRYDPSYTSWQNQLKAAANKASTDNFTLLLSHRPENVESYFEYDFDIALSGHAHGGQWRIPFIINGVFAPNQGYFPEYTSGVYDFESGKLVVSRGLSDENSRIPRIFNRPEIVYVTVK